MSPYLSPLHFVQPSLPTHCEPANEFLYKLSATFHTCVPTNLALISTLLGTSSIVSWLFAQLPQIYKNHQLKSTSGLSIFFLAEWLLGDLSNLLGSVFTHQALWQVILACYYVSVDCMLVGQWIWYEVLKHGRPLRPAWPKPTSDVPLPRPSNPMNVFRIPNFARSPGSVSGSPRPQNSPTPNTPSNRTIHRLQSSSSPMPSPRTVLYISLLLALVSQNAAAKPLTSFPRTPSRTLSIPDPPSPSPLETFGTLLSWLSTILYLGSRLPQLYKNHIRRSTAGLSPTLFLAAFFGNLFYSSSLLANPCAWEDFAPGEGRGWVSEEGSKREEWVLRAMPFFFGAAGVLVMDAAVGVQFWYFGDAEARGRSKSPSEDEDVVVVVNEPGQEMERRKWRWRRVSGWMRGWVPSVSVAATPAGTPAGTPRASSPASSFGRGDRNALEEARALLGTQRRGSTGSRARSYGGV
ncbi:hypothetical protein GQ43DRAFT_423475 [Delitschia confertaspora ATCC 74209]|uniref:PQ-loop-domain-containing protein n=1 Tax=Delitschia confertaspora ATCC 74209 TaxID=1513339 RepID=A0A9P4JK37_9PLEO|nr:hypothetical protein GQ43DRAFT_423475 [Delitschia confertaspora ATCC 74209]